MVDRTEYTVAQWIEGQPLANQVHVKANLVENTIYYKLLTVNGALLTNFLEPTEAQAILTDIEGNLDPAVMSDDEKESQINQLLVAQWQERLLQALTKRGEIPLKKKDGGWFFKLSASAFAGGFISLLVLLFVYVFSPGVAGILLLLSSSAIGAATGAVATLGVGLGLLGFGVYLLFKPKVYNERSQFKEGSFTVLLGSLGAGASLGALLGTFVFPGLGSGLGAAIGAAVGGLFAVACIGTALAVEKFSRSFEEEGIKVTQFWESPEIGRSFTRVRNLSSINGDGPTTENESSQDELTILTP